MIKRTIEISSEPVHLSVRLNQLRLHRHEPNTGLVTTIPCEDLGVVVVDQSQVTYSHHALSKLAEFGAVVLICGRNHLPTGMLLPISQNTEVVHRLRDHVNASKPCQKKIWKQIIIAKVKAQAANLREYDRTAYRKLLRMAGEIKAGDSTNVEAQAARAYWGAWLRDDPEGGRFHRDPNGEDSINILLNYGYSVMRAAVARAVVAAGLTPAFGVHHCHRANSFALADDLMEPMRPIIDSVVRDLYEAGQLSLDKSTKAPLLQTLTTTVRTGDDDVGPLMVHLHRYVASFIRCLRGEEKKLRVPMCVGK